MARGKLRIYLGAVFGVGKTYAMLAEAHRRVERGTDCVVAFLEHHDRPRTEVRLRGLEQVPRRRLEYRGAVFGEMDVDGVLRRAPAVALVDEPAHTNVPGCRNAERRQDVEDLLAAGTVPDEVVRRADQIELVDMSHAGPAPPYGARQHLPTGQGRRGLVRLLPPRQPHRPARAGPA